MNSATGKSIRLNKLKAKKMNAFCSTNGKILNVVGIISADEYTTRRFSDVNGRELPQIKFNYGDDRDDQHLVGRCICGMSIFHADLHPLLSISFACSQLGLLNVVSKAKLDS